VKLEMPHTEIRMNRYIRLALIGFIACAPISLLLWWLDCGVPWEDQKSTIIEVYYCLSGIYIPWCSAFLSDLITGQVKGPSRLTQYLAMSLAGASLGLLLLGWTSILAPKGLDFIYSHQTQALLCGGPQPLMEQARDLVPKIELLCYCKMFVENCNQCAFIFAALTIANSWIYNIVNRERVPAIFLSCLGLVLPLLIVMRIIFLNARFMVGPYRQAEPMQLLIFCASIIIMLIVTFIWSTAIFTVISRRGRSPK
jgi:hypothetical protein